MATECHSLAELVLNSVAWWIAPQRTWVAHRIFIAVFLSALQKVKPELHKRQDNIFSYCTQTLSTFYLPSPKHHYSFSTITTLATPCFHRTNFPVSPFRPSYFWASPCSPLYNRQVAYSHQYWRPAFEPFLGNELNTCDSYRPTGSPRNLWNLTPKLCIMHDHSSCYCS